MLSWVRAVGVHAILGRVRFLCTRERSPTNVLRPIPLSKSCQRVRYATCGSWARDALLTQRSLDKILKGAKSADLPAAQPTRFDLEVNLRTVKAMGLILPQTILVRVTKLVE